MDSAVGGRTEIVSIDFIFGRLCSGHLVLQHTLLSLSVFLSHTPSVSPFSSPCFPYSCSVAGLCHTFSFFFSSDLASFVLCLQCSFMAFPQHIPHSLICPFCFLFIHPLIVFCPSSPVYYFHLIYTVIFLIFFFHVTLSLPFPHPAYFTQFLSNPSSTLFCFFTCFLPPIYSPIPHCPPFSAASSFYYRFPQSFLSSWSLSYHRISLSLPLIVEKTVQFFIFCLFPHSYFHPILSLSVETCGMLCSFICQNTF